MLLTKKLKIFILIILFSLLHITLLYTKRIKIQNKYIKIIGDAKTGRFIIKTTGGDLKLAADQNVLLLYDDDLPTSFTTIRIDGQNYQFGSDKGRFITQMVKINNKIRCVWLMRNIEVTQELSFAKGFTTGNKDTVEISYIIKNKDSKEHTIGNRILLDTYLGKEDGAPFRIPGNGPVYTEKFFIGDEIPKYWYAYDSLLHPTIQAQGTLRKDKIIIPDKVIYANWSRFNENWWNIDIEEGRSFKRTIISPGDSAVAIYWDSKQFNPNDMISFKTYYGLYGADLVRGKIFNVSLSGPAVVPLVSFLITSDIQNITSSQAEDVTAEIVLPKGLTLSVGEKEKKIISNIASRDIKQIAWNILADAIDVDKMKYKVKVSGRIKNKHDVVIVERIIRNKEKDEEKMIKELLEKDLDVRKAKEGILIELGDIYFKYNSAKLTTLAKDKLNTLGLILYNYQDFILKIKGHTDNTGSKEYNQNLSESRAKSVFFYLVKKDYISQKQGSFSGFGETMPIADNSTLEGRKKNRRVEIIIKKQND